MLFRAGIEVNRAAEQAGNIDISTSFGSYSIAFVIIWTTPIVSPSVLTVRIQCNQENIQIPV